jgi:hypothetical protein
LEADLVLCVHGLERVEQHLYDGSEVRPGRDHGVSPRKATPGGKGNVTFDGSETLPGQDHDLSALEQAARMQPPFIVHGLGSERSEIWNESQKDTTSSVILSGAWEQAYLCP